MIRKCKLSSDKCSDTHVHDEDSKIVGKVKRVLNEIDKNMSDKKIGWDELIAQNTEEWMILRKYRMEKRKKEEQRITSLYFKLFKK